MTIYNFGDVVVARIKFSDQTIEKPRPAVVVSHGLYHANKPDIIVASITSNVRYDAALGEFLLSDLNPTGLKIQSRVKAYISTIDPHIIKYTIGSLCEVDKQSLHNMLRKLFI
jgi:mRNA interferase MazF